jgi:hypothetical protein
VSARLHVGTDALTAALDRKPVDGFTFSAMLSEGVAEIFELSKA